MPTEPAVPEALQRAAEAVATEVLGFANRYQRPDADELSDIFIRHVLAAKVCVEPEHQEFMRCEAVCSICHGEAPECVCWCHDNPIKLRRRAEAAEQALAAAQAERDEFEQRYKQRDELQCKLIRQNGDIAAERDRLRAELQELADRCDAIGELNMEVMQGKLAEVNEALRLVRRLARHFQKRAWKAEARLESDVLRAQAYLGEALEQDCCQMCQSKIRQALDSLDPVSA